MVKVRRGGKKRNQGVSVREKIKEMDGEIKRKSIMKGKKGKWK